MRPIVVDLFAGAGGMSLGFEQAGFDVVAAVEIDPVHAAVHAFNFPNCAVLCRDVTTVSAADIRNAAGIGARKVDVVVGGAPCQGFSMIGKRALDDPRNRLVAEFVRIVRDLDASYFVFENVKGLTLGSHRALLEELIDALRDRYDVQLPWKVLNAAEYGVPQNRERLILMGAKRGLKLPDYPAPICRPAGTPAGATALPQGPSCLDALGDLPDADKYQALWATDELRLTGKDWKEPSAYGREMRSLSNDSWHFAHPRKWTPNYLTSSLRTEHTDISKRRFLSAEQGRVEPISRLFKLPPSGVSNTLRAGTDAARGAFTSPRPIHYQHARLITVREMARLHGFPDWFRLHQTKWHGARQIGNAVPAPLARAVGAALITAMNIQPHAPEKAINLGDPALLRMDMSAAAEYFDVPVSIGRRDRKSGARKRRQHDIEAQMTLGVPGE
ncbi:DNA cytosine methyltransferase [Labrys sp. KB_33_2]|uniref:DNA cytosine methyltransferase n=1 Tax=Labrys sp. KB_33_2 TaxID=3237479 RepID=UPI003F92DF6B